MCARVAFKVSLYMLSFSPILTPTATTNIDDSNTTAQLGQTLPELGLVVLVVKGSVMSTQICLHLPG